MKTYISSALGDFDLDQYEDLEGWKSKFGLFLHLTVLFMNLILMLNLLIALLTESYQVLNCVRTGLFWSYVINEMPKLAYDAHYGILSMPPFIFSWMSFLALPFLWFIKDKLTLKSINRICFNIVYFPIAVVLLIIFMVVNFALVPFAYLKTILHKSLLTKRYKSKDNCQKLAYFIFVGIPILLVSQFTDAVRFWHHSYDDVERKHKFSHHTISQKEFEKFLKLVTDLVEKEQRSEINALELSLQMKEDLAVKQNIEDFLFGTQKSSPDKNL